MGNRAVLTFSTTSEAPAIYLHWNGGRASIDGFLQAARAIGIRHAGSDSAATLDALAETIARHFFGYEVNSMTVYRMPYGKADSDNQDNGVYILRHDMSIRGRKYAPRVEENNPKKTAFIFERITARAPIFNN